MLRTALKRKLRGQRVAAGAASTSYAKRQEQRRALRMYGIMRNASATTQQAIRTGGWANPSRMGELKFVDTTLLDNITFGNSTFAATGTLLNGLVPGSSASQRIGRKVTIKSLFIRFEARMGTTSTGGSPIRLLVVYDKQANAAAPAITDVLLTDNFLSTNNLSNRDRFVTLCDTLTDPISTSGDSCVGGTIYKRLNLETLFNAGTAGTIGDITSGSIYYFMAQSGFIGTANGSVQGRVRIRYTDI